MRQAGRYMPEYRALRANHTLLELCKNPDLAAEITLQPVERLGVDAAILFADLLLSPEAMGMRVEFVKGEGPILHNPIRSVAAIEQLRGPECAADLDYVCQALRKLRTVLKPEVALVGFGGAPFTLASYMIEGGPSRDYALTKRMMVAEPEMWNALMQKIVAVQSQFLQDQIAAGAQAIQIFDSWVGCLSAEDYEMYVLPHTQALIKNLETPGIANYLEQVTPIIHFATGVSSFLPLISRTGANVISLDWRVDLADAWNQFGDVAVQGNLDPVALLYPLPELRRRVQELIFSVRHYPGHIFNLGHGILQQTPVENVRAVVEMVHEFSARDWS
jgi:uroporphyrinogen decarboxylase